MESRNKLKIVAAILIITTIVTILVGKIYSANDNHYVVDVVKESATSKDDNMQITERIVKKSNQQYFDSKELNYEVELKNIVQENVENQIAMVIDTSYSMEVNDTNGVVKTKAIELAQEIYANIKNSRISLSNNNNTKVPMRASNTTTANSLTEITNQINALSYGEGNDSNVGLDNAYSTFTTPINSSNTVNKYIIVFTDSTDNVADKMKSLTSGDPSLKIISVLVDMTSTSYINDGVATCGDVYVLPSEVEIEDISENVNIYDTNTICDEINRVTNSITVSNTFSDEILNYFEIKDYVATNGTIEPNDTGYTWSVDKIRYQDSEKLTFKLVLKTNVDIDAGLIFNELYTNKIQTVNYKMYNNPENSIELNGTDSREGTESTVIKICQGYDLKIKAVNESNTEVGVDGITVKVEGKNEDGDIVCNLTKETDSDGYITITADEARSLRGDGKITYTVSPSVNKVGYVSTDAIQFDITNNKITRKLSFDNHESNLKGQINEEKRLVEVEMPINTQRIDFEIRAEELNNSNITISDCEFELIQPKLNNKYEMDVLSGKTESDGTLHFAPTVMTKDGTYNYILRQISAPGAYEVTNLTLIEITYKNGKITGISKQFNPNVQTELCTDKENHVLIRVGDECVEQNPFDLQINLTDSQDGAKLEGVTYLVSTTNANNQVRSEYVTTDENGQINTKLYGTGNLIIKITEQSPKVGYIADTKEKILTLNRNNGEIIVLSNESAVNLTQNSEHTNMIVNLTSTKKTEQNMVRVALVDAEEQDVTVGRNVVYYLKDEETDIKYGPAVSDKNGELSFILDTKPQGQHAYSLIVDKDTIPTEYEADQVESSIRINLTFDGNGYMVEENIANDSTVVNSHYSKVTGEGTVEYTCFITIGYKLNQDNTCEFRVQLSDKESNEAIEQAIYNINIEWDINGVTKTKTITRRKTNAIGQITTRLVKGDQVRIYVTEVGASAGYNCDNTTQEIYLTFRNNGQIDIVQSPYDRGLTNTEEPDQGAYINTGVVVYQHLNRKRSSEDTYLNLTVNKMDTQCAYVNGVILNITSSTLLDKNGAPLDVIMKTGEQGSDGTIAFDYQQYILDTLNNHTIRAPGISQEAEEVIYDLNISELKVDNESSKGYSVKDGTTVKLRLIFREKEGRVTLTNVETIYGNRLVKTKEFSSSSDNSEGQQLEDSLGVYLANITLDLYTNYDDIGNLSLDLKKQDTFEQDLIGAKYDIKVTNPDGTVLKKTTTIRNGQDSADIELTGLYVNVGSIIELTEVVAPVGYGVNLTETLEVKAIADDGEITLEQIDSSYSPNRLKLEQLASTMTSAGSLKTNYEVTFMDYQLDTFKFGITAIDSSSLEGVQGYKFNVKSSLGAQRTELETGSNGNVTTKIGGNIESNTITYTITANKAADYYKTFKTPINVNVVFDLSGNVDLDATMNAQTDNNYGKTWSITKLETVGEIEIQILVDHEDPLVVKVETIDKITNSKITDVSYKITESEVLPGTGSTSIEVGYALENGIRTYKLDETSIKNSYADISEKTFRITYTNEKITEATLTSDDTDDTITITGDKEVKIVLYANPKVPFEISNLYYFDSTVLLQGSNFEITSVENQDIGTGVTDANGMTGIYSDIFGKNKDVLYKVRQTKGSDGYATVEDFYIKVSFNDNQEITSTKLVNENGEEVANNRFITISHSKTSGYSTYNNNDKGIVKIEVLNYPEFKINIENVDRRNDELKVAGTEYSVSSTYTLSDNTTASFTSTSGVITNSNGIGIAHLDKTKDNTIVKYVVKEDIPATGYQSLGTEIGVIVTYNSEGYVSDVKLENEDTISKIAKVSKIEDITDATDYFTVNLQLKNNPILKFNLTAEDSVDHNVKIKDIGLQIVSKYNNDVYSNSSATNKVNQTTNPETSYTDINGYTASYLDRTLDNKEMYYTIKEVQKSSGYEWADKDIVIKVAYDANGKISSITPVDGGELINILSYDTENFEINIEIYNEEIKEFGIHLTTVDTYNVTKRLNGMNVEAFLTSGSSYTSDGEYELVGDNSLVSGADRDNNGTPDLAYGEDYKTMGQYNKGAGTRTLRLVIKNDSYQTSQSGYYLDSSDGTASGNNVGYYIGTKYYSDAKYQTVAYQCLINVTFDDEGKITNATLATGLNSNIGWLVDDRYVEVDENNLVDHTQYKLNITLKFFPMFDLKLNAMDNYTYQSEIDSNGQPTALTGAKYTISTTRHYYGTPTQRDEFVRAGYIGYGNDYGSSGQRVDGNIYEDTNELFVPIEKNHTRLFFVFEEAEPTNYQKYTDRYQIFYEQKLVAIISVTFDEYGEIDYDNSIVRKVDDTKIEPYMDERGTTYLSSNNIQEYKYYYNKESSNRNINFYVGYALTTKITVTAVDDISGSPIGNIKMYPFVNNTYLTNTSYEFETSGYRYTNSDGLSSWIYWGATEKDNVNSYIIGTERVGNYNGYIFPSDMANSIMGGSGNAQDYYTKLDITYDSNGKISNVKSIGADLWGDNNVSNITWDSATGNVYINMLYSRKFQVTLNKVDYYDSTINDLAASFDVISNKGLNTSINDRTMTPVGKIYKNETVKYTLSETVVPDGYYPLQDTIDYYVTFDENGNIRTNSITCNSQYFEVVNTSNNTEESNKTSPDLTINVKNKPAFALGLQVIDKFYKNDGLSNVYLNITNSKGDIALGNPQTDSRGYVNVVTGPVYPDETVTYYIRQTNTVSGYYENSTTIELQVTFNTAGKIESYKILNGNEVINNFDSTKYQNSRKVSMQIMNMPKDLNIGLYKYDKTTNQAMSGIEFTITETDMNSGNVESKVITTNDNGAVIEKIDTFNTSASGKVKKYVIHENETPASYRTMEDVVFLIRYNADGSMASCNQIANDNGVVNTKVQLNMATDGVIRYLNSQRVHFKVTVPNDNAFDLIIKNEDINYNGLGIEGSVFDVSINGETYSPEVTNENGITTVADITKSGELTINIAQKQIGEGYRYDVDNVAKIKLQKGVEIYSLDLKSDTEGYIDDKNAITTKAIIKVDETYGKIVVTFKNETKTELTVVKQDVNSKAPLKDAQFEVVAQQVDSTGNTLGDEITLTTEDNKVTDSEGKIYFDLGVAPQSQIWKYTFKELLPPDGYNPIVILSMTVTYDQYGRIAEQLSSKPSRLSAIMADSNYNCHSMYAIIYNGDVSPAYTLKVVTEDSQTGKRINGSSIYMNITDSDGNLVEVVPKTAASSNNGKIAQTKNLCIDGLMYTDEQINAEDSIAPSVILEKGLVYIDNIDYEGIINIEISQKETAPGYVFGSQHTDGNIQLEATYIPHLDEDPTVDFNVIENDGFNVIVDETNRTITVKILNESNVLFDITTKQYNCKSGEEPKPIAGTSYNITAEVQTATDSILTDINVTTPLSDENGNTKVNVGSAYAGKTVIYTIKQSPASGYQLIDDIQIEVKFDSNGYIKYYELLSSEDNVAIEQEETKGRTIALSIRNRREIGDYTIFVEKHAMDTDEDEEAYSQVLQGAKYNVTVHQEDNGTEYTTWTGTTDENGLIKGISLSGYGYITVTLEEVIAPDGYQIDDTRIIRLYRDKNTGEIEEISGDINFTHNEDYSEVYLKPIDRQSSDKYTLIINKYSTATNKYITESQAAFKAELVKEDEEGNIIYKDTIDTNYTDKKGKIVIDNLDLPDEAGIYKLIITEVKAPDGYVKLAEPVEITVNCTNDSSGNIIISTVSVDNEKVSISKVTRQLIGVNIGNDVDDPIKEDEYSLDITKVDAETNEPIESMAIFKVWLPDENNTAVYTETSETLLGPGKLDYCYIEQDKDYTVRLTHMKKPTEAGIYTYKFKEIVAPEGYGKINEELELAIEFAKDVNTGELYIKNMTSSNEKYLRINTQTPCTTDKKLSIDILNYTSEQNKFTIHYDANDNSEGTIVPEDQIKEKDVDLVLSTMKPTRSGYIFKGWATLPTSTTPQFAPGDTFTLNQDLTLYAIWEEGLYLKSDKYLISTDEGYTNDPNSSEYVDGDTYMYGIKPAIGALKNETQNQGTNISILEENITTNADTIKILKKDNQILGSNELIGTGMKLVLTKGEEEIQITLIVLGDIDGNGILQGSDKTKASNYISKDDASQFDTIEKKLALDVKLDGKIRPSDLTVLRQALSTDDNSGMGGV